jgi:hypothetical protein
MKNSYPFVWLVLGAAFLLLIGAPGCFTDDSNEDDSSGTADTSDTGNDTGEDLDGGSDGGSDGGDDGGDDGGGDGGTPSNIGTLSVDCNVPFVLDASHLSNVVYMAEHFDHLIQEYCIITTVGGVDLTSYVEKMYFGSHSPNGTLPNEVVLSLVQQSLTDALVPTYTVNVDFQPDTFVTPGSHWMVSAAAAPGQARAIVIRHESLSDSCLFAIGYSGMLTFSFAVNVTQVEGGSYAVAGTMEMADPASIPGICAIFEATIPCCL